jgi:hypothetical protein
MYFTKPVWNSSLNYYKVDFLPSYDFEHIEYYDITSDNIENYPNEDSIEFKNIMQSIADNIYIEGKNWFSSPIKQAIFLKKVKNIFSISNPSHNYGGKILRLIFSPTVLYIKSNFEIHWKMRFEKYTENKSHEIEYSEDLTQAEPTRTIVIQSHPADIEVIENEEIIFDNSNSNLNISSRAILKKHVREARLKAAIATMKAEKMAEKYFRRYGSKIQSEFDSESDLSFESEEEDSE